MKRFKVILDPCNLTSIDEELTDLPLSCSLSLSVYACLSVPYEIVFVPMVNHSEVISAV